MGLADTIRFIAHHPLSRGRRVKNLSRFVGWQLRSRVLPQPSTFAFANDARMYVERGMRGVTANLYVGLDEFDDMSFTLHLLRPGDLFVDVGANVGAYTILAAAAVGADVAAFEPGADARGWLARNIALNRCAARVEVRSEAVGSRCGTTQFTRGLDTTNHLVPAQPAADDLWDTVEITTLDAALQGRCPLMLKVDVEGFETEVIRGACATLRSGTLQCVLLELAGSGTAYGYDEAEIHKWMDSIGFTTYQYEPFQRSLTASAGKRCNNTLFIRDVEFVRKRLAEAVPFRVLGAVI